MFTFGRDHEKACSVTNLHDKAETSRIHAVIDAVHDFLDGIVTEAELRRTLYDAFSKGGGGVWEQTDTWIRSLLKDYPAFGTLWVELSVHPSWKVRWRTACVLDSMPTALRLEIGNRLKSDVSRTVREMAADRLGESRWTDWP
jgi:hypothetical protein